MNILQTEKRVQVVAALVEGNSINSIVRMTGVAKYTILNLLRDLGVCWGGGEECQRRTEGRGMGRRLDLDGYRRRYQAVRLLPHGRTDYRMGKGTRAGLQ
jgi:hypothetical protein